LYVYTRGLLGCLLGFWPLGQNPAGAKIFVAGVPCNSERDWNLKLIFFFTQKKMAVEENQEDRLDKDGEVSSMLTSRTSRANGLKLTK